VRQLVRRRARPNTGGCTRPRSSKRPRWRLWPNVAKRGRSVCPWSVVACCASHPCAPGHGPSRQRRLARHVLTPEAGFHFGQ
jgi:hypothetical protein